MNEYALVFIGAILGFVMKVIYDKLKAPSLCIEKVTGPFLISHEIGPISVEVSSKKAEKFREIYRAYRVKVSNKEKWLLNDAAENCVGWLELDVAQEPYQISWVGELSSVVINVGDRRELDFCARNIDTGEIIAPTESGYFKPRPRRLGDGTEALKGKLRVTSKNGRKDEKRIIIKPKDRDKLEIELEMN